MNPQTLFFLLGDQFLKGAAVLVIASVASFVFRRASAAKRNAIWLSAFATVLLLPFTHFAQPQWTWNPTAPAETSIVNLPLVVVAPSHLTELPVEAASAPSQEALFRVADWRMLLIATWAAGATFLLLRRVWASVQLQRLFRRSSPVQGASLHEILSCLTRLCALSRQIRMRISPSCHVPLTWSIVQPVILLPPEAETWPDDRARMVLAHELGHIRRFDSAARALAHFACAIHWFNPLIWIAARQLRLSQEQACDDLVLSDGADPAEYAAELVESVRRFQLLPSGCRQALAMAQPSTLETRVGAIMDPRRDRGSLGVWPITLSTSAVMLGLVASALAQISEEKTTPPAQPSSPGETGAFPQIPGLDPPRTVRDPVSPAAAATAVPARTTQPRSATEEKADSIIIPRLEYREATVKEAIEHLAARARDLDPQKQGVKFTFAPGWDRRPASPFQPNPADSRITLSLSNIPVGEALRYITGLAGLKFRTDAKEFTILPLDAEPTPEAAPAAPTSVPPLNVVPDSGKPSPADEPAASDKIQAIVIPVLDFREVSLSEAVRALNESAREADPAKQGVNISLDPESEKLHRDTRITVRLKNIPVEDAARYVSGLANLRMERTPNGIGIVPRKTEPPSTPPPPPVPSVKSGTESGTSIAPSTKEPLANADGAELETRLKASADPARFFDTTVPITITSREARFKRDVGIFEGNVSLVHKGITITAHRVNYNPETKLIRARGSVTVRQETNTLKVEDLELDLVTGKIKTFGSSNIKIGVPKLP
jgi:beta-lactamase regulating signal transducer with metallopeptidase domain